MRLIRSGALHPFFNMALDAALEPEPPILRLYAWDPPGLSLGYFQRAAEFPDELLAREGLVLVRRASGGAAILHRDDLTFSVVARPGDALFQGTVEESYARVHRAIARGLAGLGARAEPRLDAVARSDSGRAREAICFYRATGFDLVAGGRKLVGSAQRRTPERILHHGSIPIGRNRLAPEAACLEALLGRKLEWSEVAQAVAAGFSGELGCELVDAAPSARELEAAERLVREQFSRPEWNRRR